MIDAVGQGATVGEITATLEGVFGSWSPPSAV